MRVTIDIPEEFTEDVEDRFDDFFRRLIFDMNEFIYKDGYLMCGEYELETIEMLKKAFENAEVEE